MHELEACQVMCKLLLATRYLMNSHILDVSFGYLRVPDLVMVTATEVWIKLEGQGRVNGINGSIFDGLHAVVIAWMRGLYPDQSNHSWASRNRLGRPPEILIYCTEYSRIRGGGPWGPGRMGAVWEPFGHMRTPPFPLKYCRPPLYRINSDTGPDSLPRGIRRNEVRIYVYFGGVQVVFHFLS